MYYYIINMATGQATVKERDEVMRIYYFVPDIVKAVMEEELSFTVVISLRHKRQETLLFEVL